ncbi:unnamed protein product [Musa acuminata subsp. malaccensis]|uniref:(wild Malaysian banana) hypothetical protein n=1 Tax=Musa acuminata subsp. malaccensis TaxID=214687 RepID=A0A804HY30_MUSAM|nr:unnamed protein product [Musa acuminata subsp. malaccensis]
MSEQKVHLSVTPLCPMPNYFHQPAIVTGLLDYLWVQFYNNYCQYSSVMLPTYGMLEILIVSKPF